MAPPFEMLGPFDLDMLETAGRISFASCIILSRQKWQDEQQQLRLESYEKRHAAQERMDAQYASYHGGRRRKQTHRREIDERQHREILNLPVEGKLDQHQIKKAYRQKAQKAHPDVGGSHELFLRVTQARNSLLECL